MNTIPISLLKNLILDFSIHLSILCINNKINGTGKTLPIIETIYALKGSNPINEAASKPPLNSRIGNIEIKNTNNSLPNFIERSPPNNSIKKFIKSNDEKDQQIEKLLNEIDN